MPMGYESLMVYALLYFFVLQVFTGSKVGVVATGGIFLLQLVMLFREAKEKGTGDG
jgi:hypothetical protein